MKSDNLEKIQPSRDETETNLKGHRISLFVLTFFLKIEMLKLLIPFKIRNLYKEILINSEVIFLISTKVVEQN